MLRQTFEVELVTPCFLGGAKDQAEWRGASIRGQLRWWFRAIAGAHFSGDLDMVRVAEESIFGSTRRASALRVIPSRGPEPEGGRDKEVPFSEGLTADELAERWGDKSSSTKSRLTLRTRVSDPLHYLAYGPVTKGKLTRPLLPERTPVSFTLQWARTPAPETSQLFRDALWAWLYLGGIGARSRKGFGSLHLRRMDPRNGEGNGENGWRTPITKEGFTGKVKELLAFGAKMTTQPEWTCFSKESRVLVGSEGFDKSEAALSHLGSWLIAFRRRYGKATDSRSLGNLPVANRDYEWAAPNGTKLQQGIPDRVGFGLPLPFTRKVDGQARGETVVWGPAGDPRRASPLLLHVARFGNRYFPVLTHLPARFLPPGAHFGFQGQRPRSSDAEPEPPRPDIVTHFLDDLVKKNLVTKIGGAK